MNQVPVPLIHFGFLDRSKGQESFLDYFKQCMNKTTNKANWEAAYKHFVRYTSGDSRNWGGNEDETNFINETATTDGI